MYEYSWDHTYVSHVSPTAGIGMILGEPHFFNTEEEYRAAYYKAMKEWLVWA